MNYFDLNLHAIFGWLVRSSLHVSVLVCLIIAVKAVVGKRLAVRWHWWLWMVLVVRMVMPWAPESKVSVYNLLPEFEAANVTVPMQNEIEATAADGEPAETTSSISTEIAPLPASEQIDAGTEPAVIAAESFAIADVLPVVWLGGVLALGVYVVGSNLRLWRIVKRVRPLTDGAVLDLLEDCKEQMGVQTMLGVVVTDEVEGPALFGFVRPRLLLPSGLVERLSEGQLRHVFLHELAHLRRYDIYFGWLMAVLQVLHWFNPLVWFAFHKMRADRELACDGLALAVMGADEPAAYGQTIVSMLERFSQRQYVPGMAGILEDKGQLKRRITMIAKFKKGSYRWSALATVLLVVLGVVSLTDGHTKTKTGQSEFKATLSNGVTVELNSVCKARDNQKCWSPDGSLFSKAPYYKSGAWAGSEAFEFAFRVKNLDEEQSATSWKIDGKYATGSGNMEHPTDEAGKEIADLWVIDAKIIDGVQKCDISFGVAADPWQTQATCVGIQGMVTSKDQHPYTFSQAYIHKNMACVTVSDDMVKLAKRLIAIDNNGNTHLSELVRTGSTKGLRQSTFGFKNLKLEDVKEFQFQTQPYEWTEFKYVSLSLNFKTDVEVEVGKAAEVHTRSRTPAASPARSMTSAQRRAEAARDAAMARAKANSQKSENLQEAYNMMGPLDGMLYTSRDKLQGNDDIKSVLAVMEIALPRVEKFTGMLKDTDLAEAADIVKVQLQEVVSAMKDGDLDNAKIFLDSAYAGWSNLYHSIQKKATESKRSTSRTSSARTARAKATAASPARSMTSAQRRAEAVRDAAMARAKANSQKNEKLQEAANMMGVLSRMFEASYNQINHGVPEPALATMEIALPRFEKLVGMLDGTDLAEAADIVLVQFQEAVSAMKEGDHKKIGGLMESAYVASISLSNLIQQKVAESKRTTTATRSASPQTAQARAGAAREAAIARRKRAGVVEGREVSDRRYRVRHFVRIVSGKDEITFQGQKTTMEELAGLLEQVPDRDITVLEVGFAEMPRKPKNIKNIEQWLSENPVWRKASELRKEFGFEYLSFVGKHKLGTVSGGTRNYLVRAMKFGEEIVVNLPSAEETPLIYLRTIEFRKNKAFLRGGVTSHPKTKWDIQIAFFDENMKRLDYVFKNYENSHIGKGVAAYVRETIEVDISKIKNLEKAKFFELSIKQAEERH